MASVPLDDGVPALTFPPELLLAARGPGAGIAAAIFDVDGVLTDGRVYIGADGETVKAFSTLDGHGMKLLLQAGIVPIVVTGRDSPAVRRRMADLGLQHVAYGAADKLAAATPLLAALGLGWERVAAMGDDWPDLPLLRRAAFACAPPHAHAEVRAIARHVTAAAAGHGAARELLRSAADRLGPLRRSAARPHALARCRAMKPWPQPRRSRSASTISATKSTSASPGPSCRRRPPGRSASSMSLRPILPLLLMAALAGATWWLVRNGPAVEVAVRPGAVRHEPDYVMTRFMVRRFGPDGALRTQIEGAVLRHYPDTDTLEVDDARIHAHAADGVVTEATARRALANGDGSEVQLLGDARVLRPAVGKQEAVEFRGEFFAAFSQHRAGALAPAHRDDTGGERGPRRRHAVRQPRPRRRAQGQVDDDAGPRRTAARRALTCQPRSWSSSPALPAASARRWRRASMPPAPAGPGGPPCRGGGALGPLRRATRPTATRCTAPTCATFAAIVGAAGACMAAQGVPDVVIANAGISVASTLPCSPIWRSCAPPTKTNNLGMAATFSPFIVPMQQRGSGALVGIASVAGIRGLPGQRGLLLEQGGGG